MSSKKQKTIQVILPSGRPATIAVPKRADAPVWSDECRYLGRWGEYGLYEYSKDEIVILKLPIESKVKGIGPALLETMIATTNLTPVRAVELEMARFVTTLPENWYVVPDRNIHQLCETLPDTVDPTETQEATAEEVNGDDLM